MISLLVCIFNISIFISHMISLCIPKYPNISEKISQSDILMLSPLSLAPYPTPPGPSSSAAVPADAAGDVGGDVPSSSPRRADAADLRPGASAANDGCRCCCKPGPAAGAAASLGPPQPAPVWPGGRRTPRRARPAENRIGQSGGYISGYKWI